MMIASPRRVVGAITLAFIGTAEAQPPQPAWIADPKTGCQVWNERPKPNQTISWVGPCVGGRAEGQGTLQWFRDGWPGNRYEGEYRDGKPNGRGVLTYASGDRYEGEFRNGEH